MENPSELDRESATPFLLKLFYRTGSFHRPDEFSSPSYLPPHLPIHTWPNCTLSELSHHLAAANPPILPDPAIGTRLAFRHIYPDARAGVPSAPARFLAKDLGSLVIGHGGPGADEPTAGENGEEGPGGGGGGGGLTTAEAKTLADAKLVVGDFISCAILPPLEDTGAVAPAAAAAAGARAGRGSAVGEGSLRGPAVVAPGGPAWRDGGGGGFGSGAWEGGGRGGGFGGGFGGGRGRGPRYFGDRERDRDRDRDLGFPSGEWRRGERLPDAPPGRGRGRGSRW